MRKLTLMIIPDGTSNMRQVQIPKILIPFAMFMTSCLFTGLGYLVFDYSQIQSIQSEYLHLAQENEGLKSEARILIQNLDEVKQSLSRVQDYTAKLGELTQVKVQNVSKKTGIGPLSKKEVRIADSQNHANYLPLGVNLDNLVFKPVFNSLSSIGQNANEHAYELEKLISRLSKEKSLLASIPSIAPVNGWIASGYGHRISPFTGEKAMHRGLDIAAPVGSPVLAPADGVIIFSGSKVGFGNFIMIAHGYGIVTRYGHNQQNMVQPGQRVRRGEQIATVGMTGRTTGPHLHYEIVVNSTYENPKKFILETKVLAH